MIDAVGLGPGQGWSFLPMGGPKETNPGSAPGGRAVVSSWSKSRSASVQAPLGSALLISTADFDPAARKPPPNMARAVDSTI